MPTRIMQDVGQLTYQDMVRVLDALQSDSDAIPDYKAKELFGEATVSLAKLFHTWVEHVIGEIDPPSPEALKHIQEMLTSKVGAGMKEFSRSFWNQRARFGMISGDGALAVYTLMSLLSSLRVKSREQQTQILSLGSGYGFIETFLAGVVGALDWNVQFTCLDHAERMSELNRKFVHNSFRLVEDGFWIRPTAPVTAITADMEAVPTATASVDQVFCFDALQWTDSWEKVLDEIARVLKPSLDSRVYITIRTEPLKFYKDSELKEEVLSIPAVPLDDLLDGLEQRLLSPTRLRQMAYRQAGRVVNRMLVTCIRDEHPTNIPWHRRIGRYSVFLNQ